MGLARDSWPSISAMNVWIQVRWSFRMLVVNYIIMSQVGDHT
jgi:hypothetical protein